MSDPALSDALFLVSHPGWTWGALQETPADVIDLLGRAEQLRAEVAEQRRGR